MKFDCLKLKFMIIIYTDSILTGNKDWPFPEGLSLSIKETFWSCCAYLEHILLIIKYENDDQRRKYICTKSRYQNSDFVSILCYQI